MTEISWSLFLLTRMAGVNVVLGKSVDAREPVILNDQFDSSGDAEMTSGASWCSCRISIRRERGDCRM